MRIAFDAKRAYQNNTGLGNYSRRLIDRLAADFPEHQYFAMAPKKTSLYTPASGNIQTITPTGISKIFSSVWRSNWVKSDLKKLKIDLYHGLSHEIPICIQDTGIRSVVTMHDLIFEYYPSHFKAVDVAIYRKKFKYAAKHADRIITVSQQTKDDLVKLYHTPADKIDVCYTAADEAFEHLHTEEEKARIRIKYKLPQQFFLSVGSVIERKNLLNICKAIKALKGKLDIPLVVIGGINTAYALQVKNYIKEQGLENDVLFMADRPESNEPDFKNSKDIPAIYQCATAMAYPSVYEGFGLPVLEGLWSGTPVITSGISCLPEAGGDAAYYIDPLSVDELVTAMEKVTTDELLRASMIQKGFVHARTFTTTVLAQKTMQSYLKLK